MSSSVSLELDGKTFDVLRCFSSAKQGFDESGNPISGVVAGRIGLILQGTAEDVFNKWIGDPQKAMDGKVTFSIDDSAFKKLEFKNGFLTRLHESFHDEGNVQVPLTDRISIFDGGNTEDMAFRDLDNYYRRSGYSFLLSCTISAEKISIDGVEHDNHW